MNILITDTLKVNSIQMKAWSDNDGRWSPDMYADIADNTECYPIPAEFKSAVAGTDIMCAMTSKEFADTVEWWENEIDLYNKRDPRSWFFDNADDDAIASVTDELALFVEEDVMPWLEVE